MGLQRTMIDRMFASFRAVGSRKTAIATIDETSELQLFSGFSVTINSVTTTAAKIDTIDESGNFFLTHRTFGAIVYIGDENVTALTGFPLDEGDVFELENMQKGNNNEIYAIATVATDLYCVGTIKI